MSRGLFCRREIGMGHSGLGWVGSETRVFEISHFLLDIEVAAHDAVNGDKWEQGEGITTFDGVELLAVEASSRLGRPSHSSDDVQAAASTSRVAVAQLPRADGGCCVPPSRRSLVRVPRVDKSGRCQNAEERRNPAVAPVADPQARVAAVEPELCYVTRGLDDRLVRRHSFPSGPV